MRRRRRKLTGVTNDTGKRCRASHLTGLVSADTSTDGTRYEGGEIMSKEVLEQVILKASSDARFRAQMNDNFDAALRPYDLSPAEKAKLRSGVAGLSDDREVRR